ncbi:histidine phosphatase family protein [Sediminicoccus rosea]|jgi:alpha-ribazole phosphatase|uniref:Histidine phosphatase family protein n=1 Tax=Sediminicoccus rosea TaxID=1225128 RepID=A0ABZ0PJ01_9PROT|nr:histidine phosphatase family protein [Sediminicoccus rosea]WPB85607.1 histidine phosphatase family protein [Sediminicoccus rosea]
MALTLLRHLRPVVAPGICYGVTDLDLAEAPAAALDALLARLPPASAIATSPLRRCRLLAEAIGEARGLPVLADPRLMEMDFGAWEGVAWNDIPRAELDEWAADFLHARPHGGESVAQLQARTRAALVDHRARAGHALLVTHAGVIKAALATGPRAEDWPPALAFGEFVTI